jgi:hypothetical protein
MRRRVAALITRFGFSSLAASGRPALPPSSLVISAIRSPQNRVLVAGSRLELLVHFSSLQHSRSE